MPASLLFKKIVASISDVDALVMLGSLSELSSRWRTSVMMTGLRFNNATQPAAAQRPLKERETASCSAVEVPSKAAQDEGRKLLLLESLEQ